jgi:PHD-finger
MAAPSHQVMETAVVELKHSAGVEVLKPELELKDVAKHSDHNATQAPSAAAAKPAEVNGWAAAATAALIEPPNPVALAASDDAPFSAAEAAPKSDAQLSDGARTPEEASQPAKKRAREIVTHYTVVVTKEKEEEERIQDEIKIGLRGLPAKRARPAALDADAIIARAAVKEASRQAAAEKRDPLAHSDELCFTCKQLDEPNDTDLLMCQGTCLRSFHLACLDLGEEEVAEIDPWLCEDCENGSHECGICGDVVSADDTVRFLCCYTPYASYICA